MDRRTKCVCAVFALATSTAFLSLSLTFSSFSSLVSSIGKQNCHFRLLSHSMRSKVCLILDTDTSTRDQRWELNPGPNLRLQFCA